MKSQKPDVDLFGDEIGSPKVVPPKYDLNLGDISAFFKDAWKHEGYMFTDVAAQILGVSRQTIHNRMRSGKLRHRVFMGKVWVYGADVTRMLLVAQEKKKANNLLTGGKASDSVCA